MNSILKMRFVLVSGLIWFGLFAAGSASGQPCVYDHTSHYCVSDGYVTLTAPGGGQCVSSGNSITISAGKIIVDDTNETVDYYRNTTSDATPDEMPGCPQPTSIGSDVPNYSVTWTAKVGSFTTSGTGTTATFTPTDAGSGTVTFTCNYFDQSPCTGAGSSSVSGGFTVVDSTPITTTETVDFSAMQEALDSLAKFFSQGDVCDFSGPGGLALSVSKETSTVCCDGTPGSKVKISCTQELGLGSVDCTFPFAGIPFVITANVDLNASASVKVSINGTKQCGDTGDICGTISGEGSGGGGVSVVVGSPKLLKAALDVNITIDGSGSICRKEDGTYDGSADLCGHASIVGSITFFGGIKKSISAPLGGGCTPEYSI